MKTVCLKWLSNKTLYFFFAFLVVMFAESCESFNKVNCDGCPKDIPWSTQDGEYCYPDEETCKEEQGVSECFKCDK
jgi:hypothetical protein